MQIRSKVEGFDRPVNHFSILSGIVSLVEFFAAEDDSPLARQRLLRPNKPDLGLYERE